MSGAAYHSREGSVLATNGLIHQPMRSAIDEFEAGWRGRVSP
jgi:hypothetical protein